MKFIKILSVLVLFIATSCVSVKVASDYDATTNFSEFKTYAFYKKGIEKADFSDLDKRRILSAIESELANRGFSKSENPDVLVNIFTKTTNKVNVRNNNMGWGAWGAWGAWGPWFWGGWNWGWGAWGAWGPWGPWGGWGLGENDIQVTQSSQGTLFIDVIDAKKKELAWQGVGSGTLHTAKNAAEKDLRIKTFVSEIMANYPPGAE